MLRCASATLAVAAVLVGAPTSSYAAPGDACAEVVDVRTPPGTPPTDSSRPLEELQIARAQQLTTELSGREPGEGVRIAVVDAGVQDLDAIPEYDGNRLTEHSATGEHTSHQGTALAGIIAGAPVGDRVVGIAPAARIYDERIYDTSETPDDGRRAVSVEGLVAGLDDLLDLVGTGPDDIRIVNVSLQVADDPRLEAAVDRVTRAGAIVVAAAGDRVDDPDWAYRAGEDYADRVFPAGYARGDRNPRVVAVATTIAPGTDDPASPPGVLSSAIDVAVPTYGALSYAVNRSTCGLYTSSTAVAAAEVSGILALLMTVFPEDAPEQLIARLEVTAAGGSSSDPARPDKYVGRGVVQPLDALTRVLSDPLAAAGPATRDDQRVAPARLPEPEADVLGSAGRDALGWGLVGGGAIVVALLLRPVLSRRR